MSPLTTALSSPTSTHIVALDRTTVHACPFPSCVASLSPMSPANIAGHFIDYHEVHLAGTAGQNTETYTLSRPACSPPYESCHSGADEVGTPARSRWVTSIQGWHIHKCYRDQLTDGMLEI